ncbi:MAG: hypothetical protein JWO31_135, partial [Phycisphaerales bacterium]|nr:hypothetical protein [Phycisphaerales bacterium]
MTAPLPSTPARTTGAEVPVAFSTGPAVAGVGATPRPQPYLKIRATSGWAALNLRETWQFRDLL